MSRRPIAYPLLLWYLTGCTTWRVQDLSPQQIIDRWHPGSVRITTANSSELVLDQPRIVGGDSLVGAIDSVPKGVAISDVRHIAIRRFSVGKTVGLYLAVQTVAFIVAHKGPGTGLQ
jgi:hypothetical protein